MVRESFRVVIALARVDRLTEASQLLLSLPRSRFEWRHESIRSQSLESPAVALSPTGELPATHIAQARPFSATILDGDAFKPHLVWLNELAAPGTDAVRLHPSYSQFAWVVSAEDLAGKVREHLDAVLSRAGLKVIQPQPEVPRLEWHSPTATAADMARARPLHLPSGRFALIRDRYIDMRGDLVIEAEYWASEDDYRARPDEPREAHDHGFTIRDPATRQRRPIAPADELRPLIISVMAGSRRDDGHRGAVRRDRHGADPYGYLLHPHVQGLEVTI